MEQITVSDITIDVIRKQIRNIHLAVYPPTGRVRIAAPLQTTDDTIRLFAISKLAWIRRNQRKFEGQERITPREFKNRESHYFNGQRYLLNIIETDAPPKVVLKNKNYIDLYIRPESPTAKKLEVLNEWYRAHLKTVIPGLIGKWEKIMSIEVNEWQVRQMKTKWGSCNIEEKRIWINLELAKKPEHCLEYILVHEMVHLMERHHNERFHHFLETYLPNWKQLKTELNQLPVSHADWEY
jgi:predicted metal-dependent hydrolase